MAWSNMAMDVGVSAVQGITSLIAERKKAKSDKAWQEWRNKVTRIANAQNQNNITLNQNLTMQRNALQKAAIEKSERLTTASTAVAAAAMGVRGNSVAQTLREVNNNAAEAQTKRQLDLNAELVSMQAARENSELQTYQQTEFSPIPKPTGASQLLNFAGDVADSWGKNKDSIKSKL